LGEFSLFPPSQTPPAKDTTDSRQSIARIEVWNTSLECYRPYQTSNSLPDDLQLSLPRFAILIYFPLPLSRYALCQQFLAHGCIVYATARRLSSIESLPSSVHKIALDVLSNDACKDAVEQVVREQGRIDVLVNNAGAGGTGALLDADVESDEGAKATVGFLSLSFFLYS